MQSFDNPRIKNLRWPACGWRLLGGKVDVELQTVFVPLGRIYLTVSAWLWAVCCFVCKASRADFGTIAIEIRQRARFSKAIGSDWWQCIRETSKVV